MYSLKNLMTFVLIQVRKIQIEIWIQAVLCMKVNCMKKCQIFRNLLYLMVWRVQDLHFSVQVEWMWTLIMKLMFWNVFRSLLMKICGSCLLNKQIYMPNNFWQQILIWNHDPELEVGWIQTQLKWKTLIGLLILQGIVQKPENGMYFSKRVSIVTPYFSQMTEKRFHLLLKFLHFSGNSKFDPDRNHKKL